MHAENLKSTLQKSQINITEISNQPCNNLKPAFNDDFNVILATGARQIGKTTLLKSITKPGRDYIALDRKKDLEIARDDQKASFMIHRLTYLIDKIQRGR